MKMSADNRGNRISTHPSIRLSKFISIKALITRCAQSYLKLRLYPKGSGLAAWSQNCKSYSSLPLGAVVSLFCEWVWWVLAPLPPCVASQLVFIVIKRIFRYRLIPETFGYTLMSQFVRVKNNFICELSANEYAVPQFWPCAPTFSIHVCNSGKQKQTQISRNMQEALSASVKKKNSWSSHIKVDFFGALENVFGIH
jgi:hypothetical protein